MDSRTYSVDELLMLRHVYSSGAIKQLKSNHEIANIIKNQSNVSSDLCPPMKMANGDVSSSTEGEEVIFQGKANPQTQWRYRGRTEDESATDEPIKAPTGLHAQRSEGFKRFYKAVVSPTHVRVTAGGRIVPNTRGSPSPTAKWDKEHSSAGAQETLGSLKDVKSEPSTHLSGQATYHPLMPPPYTGHSGVFHHMGLPMPLYPIHPALAYGMPTLPLLHSGGKQASSAPGQKSGEAGPKSVKTQDGAGDKKPRPAPIKIAPPDQFDQNRPFYFNGNVVFPSPYAPGQTMTLPSPYYSFGSQIGSLSQPSPLGPGFNPALASPAFASPTFAGPGRAGSAPGPWPLSAPNPNMGPHITTIRPSEVTRRQLKQLRQSLKYYEDQLQYNRHQIDEKCIEEQVQKIRHSIREFENQYKSQAYIESTQTPPSSGSQGRRLQTPSGRSSMRSHRGADVSEASSIAGSMRGYGPKSTLSPYNSVGARRRPRFRNKNLKGIGINYTTGILAPFAPEDPTLEALIKTKSTAGRPEDMLTSPDGEPASTYDLGEPQLYGVRAISQLDVGHSGLYMSDRPTPVSFGQNRPCQPYLVGKLPQGMNVYDARSTDYVYERQLTDGEKQARENYWGKVAMSGSGLPKFDGQNFYPPSPVKTSEQNSRHAVPVGRPPVDYKMHTGPTDNDPFSSSRTTQSIRPQTGGQKFSKAIPIVAPKDGPKSATSHKMSQSNGMSDDICKATKSASIPIPTDKASEDLKNEKKSTPGRRNAERSSKSGHDLWQTMLKKGSTSSTVLPSAVSSTNATGYLPPYQGNAAASLCPSVSNANSSGARVSSQAGDKTVETDPSQPATEKVGENCPPSEARSADYDPLKDVQERMIRDAQRRGVIGSD
ncbi:hypothetical protein GGR53DRAFT_518929 [Hypoxylon sp. FL1150]|nr:hypothetical protein GGR53DRAFT_518929 [Hypoxylon sp. FL1150]